MWPRPIRSRMIVALVILFSFFRIGSRLVLSSPPVSFDLFAGCSLVFQLFLWVSPAFFLDIFVGLEGGWVSGRFASCGLCYLFCLFVASDMFMYWDPLDCYFHFSFLHGLEVVFYFQASYLA